MVMNKTNEIIQSANFFRLSYDEVFSTLRLMSMVIYLETRNGSFNFLEEVVERGGMNDFIFVIVNISLAYGGLFDQIIGGK